MSSPESASPALLASAWARGKLILTGEHSVVYGRPALAIGLERGLQLRFSRAEEDRFQLQLAGDRSPAPRAWVKTLLETAWATLGARVSYPLLIERGGALPLAAGLGGSAALAVALLRGLATLLGRTLSRDELLQGAAALEAHAHGTASGIDHTVSVLGGALRFERRDEGARWAEVSAPVSPPLVLSWVPRHGSTREVVAALRSTIDASPRQYEEIFDEIGQLTERAVGALRSGDWSALAACCERNHQLLQRCAVSDPRVEEGLALMRHAGALGAKMSGAGWGGAFFAIAPGRQSEVAAALQSAGLPAWLPPPPSRAHGEGD